MVSEESDKIPKVTTTAATYLLKRLSLVPHTQLSCQVVPAGLSQLPGHFENGKVYRKRNGCGCVCGCVYKYNILKKIYIKIIIIILILNKIINNINVTSYKP